MASYTKSIMASVFEDTRTQRGLVKDKARLFTVANASQLDLVM